MKRFFYSVATILVATLCLNTNVFAQNIIEKDYIFSFGNSHKDTALIRVLYENAPKYFNAPDMPRFTIIGKQRAFYLGIGGFVKGTLSYDLGNPIQSPIYFEPSSIPMTKVAGNNSLVQFSAATSNLFFNFVGMPHSKNQIGAYINFNFSGTANTYGFSLRGAYLTYRNFLVGYNSSLFTDGAACTPTIDQQGPNAMTFVFNTVINYQYSFNNHYKFGVGLEMPSVNATYGSVNYAVNQSIPDIPFYLQYNWKNAQGWIRLSGLWRNMYYRDVKKDENIDAMGWAVKLSGGVPLCSKATMFFQGVYGYGIGSYIQDMQGLGLDVVPDYKDAGKMKPVEAFGVYGGIQTQLCKKILTSATYSFVRSYLPESYINPPSSTYKSATYIVANMFYSITPTVTTGIEYLWGYRKNINNNFKQDTRLQMALRVNF